MTKVKAGSDEAIFDKRNNLWISKDRLFETVLNSSLFGVSLGPEEPSVIDKVIELAKKEVPGLEVISKDKEPEIVKDRIY